MSDASPPSASGPAWFEGARKRIADFARPSGPPRAAAPAGPVPAPEHLAEIIASLAAKWSPVGGGAPVTEKLTSPEAAVAFAAGRGVDAEFARRRIATIEPSDLPLAMICKSGEARLLLSRDGDQFRASAAGRVYTISLAALRIEEAGLVFLLRAPENAIERGDPSTPREEDLSEAEDPVRRAIDYVLHRQRPLLIKMLMAAAFSNLMLLTLPIYTSVVFDRVIPHSAWETLWAISIGVFLALGADLSVRWARTKLQDAIATTASAALQATTFRRMVEVKMSDAPRSASSIQIRLREIDGLAQLAPQFIAGVAVDAPFLILVFALIYANGGPVVLAPVVGLTMLGALHFFGENYANENHHRSVRLAQAQTGHLFETAEGLESLKAACAERKALGRFERIFDEYAYVSHMVRAWHSFLAYANMTVGQMMVVLVMVLGVYQVTHGDMTVGGLSACSLLVGRIISPIGQLVGVVARMRLSRATLKALSRDVRAHLETAGDRSGAAIPRERAPIRLSGVTYRYPGQTGAQLDDVSFAIQPGEKVGIVGRSGSGKSTLLKLLVRFVEAEQGSYLYGEVDARQYAPQDVRRMIGYMSQTPGLFDDTLLANLTLGRDTVDPRRLEEIARLSGVLEFCGRHPQGFGMKVGPRGEMLSGGERQSVALARTLLGERGVLALDEPTSAMDTMLEMRLVRDLKAFVGERTLIVSTHRAPVLSLVDRVIWLEAGRVIADGPKAEVLRRMAGGEAAA